MTQTKVHSKALNTTIEVQRLIGHIKGAQSGPTLIFVGGIHGNEPAGVYAIERVFKSIDYRKLAGNVYGIAGNLSALKKGVRYHKEDLNRLWTKENLARLAEDNEEAAQHDQHEMLEVHTLIQQIMHGESGPFYFFDIHTTSSDTVPFLTVNDSLINRYFTSQYPIPTILGIEEYLTGPILSYINELGYVAFGFEAGQHDTLSSIENAQAFILLSLVFAGALQKEDINYLHHYHQLEMIARDIQQTYEIRFRYLIQPGEDFKMNPGFQNFQQISTQELLALSNGEEIRAKHSGRIFMPLYQSQGVDGFFEIKRIRPVFLTLSEILRTYRIDRLLTLLPGVKWLNDDKSTLEVNRKIARFLAKDLLHLFGYRQVYQSGEKLLMVNREHRSRTASYSSAPWML